MRKIEQWMIETIKAQKAEFAANKYTSGKFVKTNGNTRVTTAKREDGAVISTVYLHENMIAQDGADGHWGFKMCGWPTPTTRGRINALCREFGYVGVNQSKGKQWCGSSEIGIHDWFHPRKTSV